MRKLLSHRPPCHERLERATFEQVEPLLRRPLDTTALPG